MSDFDEAYEDDEAVFGDPYPALIETLRERSPGRLLDLGCGQGRNAVALAALGYEVTAVDASVVGVEQTTRAATDKGLTVQGVVADLAGYRIESAYDVVVMDMVLHSFDDEADRHRILDQIASGVAPGGVVYVVVPEPGPLVAELEAAFAPWPRTVTSIRHRLTSGEHAGEYTFTAFIAERTAP